jgi:hypothetical protein
MDKHAYRKTEEGRARDRLNSKNWKSKNKEKAKLQSKGTYERHREKYTFNLRERNRIERMKILGFLGGMCVVCGEVDWRCLQIDHVNGDGRQERIRLKSPGLGPYYSDIREHPEKYQILCANHNWIKRYEKDELNRRKDQKK